MSANRVSDRPALLIVDDEAQILSALKRSLRRERFEIIAAESAAEALQVLGERAVEGILTDHKMPGMSGVQLLERAAKLQPSAVRMLITGWTQEIPPERLAEIGVRALVTKPWDDAKLKATLRALLEVAPRASRETGGLGTRDRSSDYSLRR